MPAKRPRSSSGLSDVNLAMVVNTLKLLVEKSREKQTLNEDNSELKVNVAELEQLDVILQAMQTQDVGAQSYPFSNVTQDHLDKMGISASGFLKLKPGAMSRAAGTDALGADSIWSSDMLCRHLQFLQGLVPRRSEAAMRLWINAFFYRAAVMIPSGLDVVLSVEKVDPSGPVSNAHSLSGHINWTAIVMASEKAQRFLRYPVLQLLKNDESVLLVSEGRDPESILADHVQETVGEMVACARITGKFIIRGVLTNGRRWIFLKLKLNDDGSGIYKQSEELNISTFVMSRIAKEAISLNSAIILHWMLHSHEDLDGEDDYFHADDA